jgi:hypothetical protein
MNMTDSGGNVTYALRNAVAALTTLLSPKQASWWAPTNSTTEPAVIAMIFNSSGQCYAVGTSSIFTNPKFNDIVCGSATNGFAVRLSSDGTVDAAFSVPSLSGQPLCCSLDGAGNLIMGGNFPLKKLAASNGAPDAGFIMSATQHDVYSIKAISGDFWIGMNAAEGIRKVSGTDGSTLGGFTSANFNGGSVFIYGIDVTPGGNPVAVGQFTTYGGTGRTGFAVIDTTGVLQSPNPNITGGIPQCVLAQQDGKFLIGGNFTAVDGLTRHCFARLNSNGTVDTGFSCGCDGQVLSLVQNSRGETTVGGLFTHIGGSGTGSLSRNYIARVDANGVVLGI